MLAAVAACTTENYSPRSSRLPTAAMMAIAARTAEDYIPRSSRPQWWPQSQPALLRTTVLAEQAAHCSYDGHREDYSPRSSRPQWWNNRKQIGYAPGYAPCGETRHAPRNATCHAQGKQPKTTRVCARVCTPTLQFAVRLKPTPVHISTHACIVLVLIFDCCRDGVGAIQKCLVGPPTAT